MGRHRGPVAAGSCWARGRYRLTWNVVSDDAHTRSGRLAFTVTAAAKSPVTASTPHTSAASRHVMDGGARDGTRAGTPGTDHVAGGETPADPDAADPDAGQEAPWWGMLGTAGRWLSIGGVLIAVGALIVVVTTLVGAEGDVALSQRVIRAAGTTSVVGATLEGTVLALTLGGAVPRLAAAAVLTRLAGAAMLAVSLGLRPRPAGGSPLAGRPGPASRASDR